MANKEFIFECGCEEIPARFIDTFLEQLKDLFSVELKRVHIKFNDIFAYGTYRRLVIHITDLADKQTAVSEFVKGPPVDIAYDKNTQKLSKAGLGFLKKLDSSESELLTKNVDGRDYVAVLKKAFIRDTESVLPEIITHVFEKLPLPIAMKWGAGEGVFVRPLHWICALYGHHKINVSLFGVKSNNKTFGHRFLTHGKDVNGIELTVSSAKDYFDKILKKGALILDQSKRKSYISEQLLAYNQQNFDEELLDEVIYLVEHPKVLIGEFDTKFLTIPSVVLVECMKKHQKYFPLYNDMELTNKFLFVADNVTNENSKYIINGNERVLSARLEDALFFWNEDRKQKLSDYSEKLKGLVYQHNLGSMFDKQERVAELLLFFHSQSYTLIDKKVLKKCAVMSKLDLVTQMVMEFPKLQGQMGALYAAENNEDISISNAISEQYLPSHYGGELPGTPLGIILSLADRFDHLVASFFNGAKPTGSQDPLGLRRAVYSIFSLLFYLKIEFDFKQTVNFCYKQLGQTVKNDSLLYEFVNQRLKTYLMDHDLRYDTADAVLHIGYQNIAKAIQIGVKFEEYRSIHQNQFKVIVDTAIRVKRLAIKSESSDIKLDLFKLDIEKSSFKLLEKGFADSNQLDLDFYYELSNSLVDYFEGVMVMDKNKTIQKNRLAFMTQCNDIYLKVLNFEKIVLD